MNSVTTLKLRIVGVAGEIIAIRKQNGIPKDSILTPKMIKNSPFDRFNGQFLNEICRIVNA